MILDVYGNGVGEYLISNQGFCSLFIDGYIFPLRIDNSNLTALAVLDHLLMCRRTLPACIAEHIPEEISMCNGSVYTNRQSDAGCNRRCGFI